MAGPTAYRPDRTLRRPEQLMEFEDPDGGFPDTDPWSSLGRNLRRPREIDADRRARKPRG